MIHNRFYVFISYYVCVILIRFDEVDDANPNKKPTIHEVLLAGKRKSQRLPFEHELQVPRGNLINNFVYVCTILNVFINFLCVSLDAYIEKVNIVCRMLSLCV